MVPKPNGVRLVAAFDPEIEPIRLETPLIAFENLEVRYTAMAAPALKGA